MAGIRVNIGASIDQRDLSRVEMQVNKVMKRMSGKEVAFNINGRSFTQPLGRITSQANEFTKSLEASNARVIAFGASVGIINAVSESFKGLVAETIRFEKTLSDINVILNASNQGIQAFGDNLFKVAKNTAQGFNVVATAALEFSRQGLSMEETLKRTNDALILTRLTSLKAEEAVAGLTAAVNAFAATGLTTTNIIDKLAAVDVRFAVSSEDLIHALERTGAVAIDAGVELNDLIGLVTALQQTTARGGAVIGNGLKTIFTRIQRPESLRQIQEMGIGVKNLTGAILPADKILLNLAKSFDTLSHSQQSNVVQFSAGIFQANVFRAALRDLSKEQSLYGQASDVAAAAAGEAAMKNEQLNKTLSALASQSGSAIKELAGVMGDLMLKPEIGGFMEAFLASVEGLKNSLGGGEDEGNTFAKGFVRGLGNVLTGPGLLAFGAVFVKMLMNVGKFASQSIKDVLGIVDKKEKIKQMEEAIVNVLSENKAIQEGLNELEGDRAAQEKFILKIIEMQTNAMVKQKQVAASLSGPLIRAGVNTDLTVNSQDFVDLDGNAKIESFGAHGVIPRTTVEREKRGAREGGYQPGPVDAMEVKGMGRVIYNKAETIKKFPGMDQPAIMPPAASRAGQNYKKDFNKEHGFNPYASLGFVPNYSFGKQGTRIRNDVTEGMRLFGTTDQNLKSKVQAQLKRQDGTLGASNIHFDIPTSSFTGKMGNIGKYLEALGVNDIQTVIPFDFIDHPVNAKGRRTRSVHKGLTEGTTKQRGNFAEKLFMESGDASGYISTGLNEKLEADKFLDDQAVVDAVKIGGPATEVKAASIDLQNIMSKSIRRYSNKSFRKDLNDVVNYFRDPTRASMPNKKLEGFETNGDLAEALAGATMKLEEDSIIKNLSTLARMGLYNIPGYTGGQTKSSVQGGNFRRDLMGQGGYGDAEKQLLEQYRLSGGLVPNFMVQGHVMKSMGNRNLPKILKKIFKINNDKKTIDARVPVKYLASEDQFIANKGQNIDQKIISGKRYNKDRELINANYQFGANDASAVRRMEKGEPGYNLFRNTNAEDGHKYEAKIAKKLRRPYTKNNDRIDFMELGPENWQSFGPKGAGPKSIAKDWLNADAHKGEGHKLKHIASKLYAKGLISIEDILEGSLTGQNIKIGKEYADIVGGGVDSLNKESQKSFTFASPRGFIKDFIGGEARGYPEFPTVKKLMEAFQRKTGDHLFGDKNFGLTYNVDAYRASKGLIPNFAGDEFWDNPYFAAKKTRLTDKETGTTLDYKELPGGGAEVMHAQSHGKKGGHHRNLNNLIKKFGHVGSGMIVPQRPGKGPTPWAKLLHMYPQLKNRVTDGVRTLGDFTVDDQEMPFESLVQLKKVVNRFFNEDPNSLAYMEKFDTNPFFDDIIRIENLSSFKVKGKGDSVAGFKNKGLVPNFVRYDKSRGGSETWEAIPDNRVGKYGGVFTGAEVEKMRNDGWARTDEKGWHFAGGGRAGVDRVEKEAREARRKLAEAQGMMRGGGKMIINNQTGEMFHGMDHQEIAQENNLYDNGGLPFHFLKTHMGTKLFDSRAEGGKGGYARKMFASLRDKTINQSVLAKLKNIAEQNAMVLLRDDMHSRNREGDILYDSRGVLGNPIFPQGLVPNFYNLNRRNLSSGDKMSDRQRLLMMWQNKQDEIKRTAKSGKPRIEKDPIISRLNGESNEIWDQLQLLKAGKDYFIPNYNVNLSNGYHDKKAISSAIGKVYKSKTGTKMKREDLSFAIERYISAIDDKQLDDGENFISNYPGGHFNAGGQKFNFNEISMALLNHGQFHKSFKNEGLVPNFSALQKVRESQKRRISGDGEHVGSRVRVQDAEVAENIFDYMRLNISGLSPKFGFDKKTLGFRATSSDLADVIRASKSIRNRENLIEIAGGESILDRVLQSVMKSHTEGVLSARGRLKKHVDPFMAGAMSRGLVPNFNNPLMDAINREKAAGVPGGRIRIEKSSQLKSPQNPAGLAVTNTRDEPGGIAQGIRRAKTMGLNPKTHGAAKGFSPNFAKLKFKPGVSRKVKKQMQENADASESVRKIESTMKEQTAEIKDLGVQDLIDANKKYADAVSKAAQDFKKGDKQAFNSPDIRSKAADFGVKMTEQAGKDMSSKDSKKFDKAQDAVLKHSQAIGKNLNIQKRVGKESENSLQNLFFMQSAISMVNGQLQQMAEDGGNFAQSLAKGGLAISNVAASFMQAKEIGSQLQDMIGTGKNDGTGASLLDGSMLTKEGRKKRKAKASRIEKNIASKAARGGKGLGAIGRTLGMVGKFGRVFARFIPVVGQLYTGFTILNEGLKLIFGKSLFEMMESASATAAKKIESLGKASSAVSSALEALASKEQNAKKMADLEAIGQNRTIAQEKEYYDLRVKAVDVDQKVVQVMGDLSNESKVGKEGIGMLGRAMERAGISTFDGSEKSKKALQELSIAIKQVTLATTSNKSFMDNVESAIDRLSGKEEDDKVMALAESFAVQSAHATKDLFSSMDADALQKETDLKKAADAISKLDFRTVAGDASAFSKIERLQFGPGNELLGGEQAIKEQLAQMLKGVDLKNLDMGGIDGGEAKIANAMMKKYASELRGRAEALRKSSPLAADANVVKAMKLNLRLQDERNKISAQMLDKESKLANMASNEIIARQKILQGLDLISKHELNKATQLEKENQARTDRDKKIADAQTKFADAQNKLNLSLLNTDNLNRGLTGLDNPKDKASQFNKRIGEAAKKGNVEQAIRSFNLNAVPENQIKNDSGIAEKIGATLGGINIGDGADFQVKLAEIFNDLLSETDNSVRMATALALKQAQVLNLEDKHIESMVNQNNVLAHTIREANNGFDLAKVRNANELRASEISSKTIEGAREVLKMIKKRGDLSSSINQNLMGEALHSAISNDERKKQIKIETQSTELRAKILENLREEVRNSTSTDFSDMLKSKQRNLAMSGFTSGLNLGDGKAADKLNEIQANILTSLMAKAQSEIESATASADEAKIRRKFFSIHGQMERLTEEKARADMQNLAFATHELARRTIIDTNLTNLEATGTMQLQQEVLQSIASQKTAETKRRLMEQGNERFMLLQSQHETEMEELKTSVRSAKDRLGIAIVKGDIKETAELQLEQELVDLQNSSLIAAQKELILSSNTELAKKMQRANELQEMTNGLSEMRAAKERAFVDQMTLEIGAKASITGGKLGAFGDMREAGTKASISGNADDLASAAQAQLNYNRLLNGSTSALDQVNVELANIGVSASNLKGDLVSIGFETARSELKDVFKSIATGTKGAGEAFGDMANNLGAAISDRLMEHNIDQIMSNLMTAITGKSPEDEADRMRNAISEAHNDHVAKLKSEANAIGGEMAGAIEAKIKNIEIDAAVDIPDLKTLEEEMAGFAGKVAKGFERGGEDFQKKLNDTLGGDTLTSALVGNTGALIDVEKAVRALEKVLDREKEKAANDIKNKKDAEELSAREKIKKEEQQKKKLAPPPVAEIPSQTTKELLKSLSDQLEKRKEDSMSLLGHNSGQTAANLVMSNTLNPQGEVDMKKLKSRKDFIDEQFPGLFNRQLRAEGGKIIGKKYKNDIYFKNLNKKGEVTDRTTAVQQLPGRENNLTSAQMVSPIKVKRAEQESKWWNGSSTVINGKPLTTKDGEVDAFMNKLKALSEFSEKLEEAKKKEATSGGNAAESLDELKQAAIQLGMRLKQIEVPSAATKDPKPTADELVDNLAPDPQAGPLQSGGIVKKYHDGGFVKGFQKGGEVPAILQEGEFVVPRKYAQGGKASWGERAGSFLNAKAQMGGTYLGSYLANKWWGPDKPDPNEGRPTFDEKSFNTLGLGSDVDMKANDSRLSARFRSKNRATQDYQKFLQERHDFDLNKTNQAFKEKSQKYQGYIGAAASYIAAGASKGVMLTAKALPGLIMAGASGVRNFVQGTMGLGNKDVVAKYRKLRDAGGEKINYGDISRQYSSMGGRRMSKDQMASFESMQPYVARTEDGRMMTAFGTNADGTPRFSSNARHRDRQLVNGRFVNSKFGGDYQTSGFYNPRAALTGHKTMRESAKANRAAKGESSGSGFFGDFWKEIHGKQSGGQIPAMLTRGESIIPGDVAKKIGYDNLNKMNTTGEFPIVKGRGGIDNVGPVSLNSGDFVLKQSSTNKLNRTNPNLMRFAASNPEGFRRTAARGYYNGGVVGSELTYPSTSMGSGEQYGTRQAPELSPQTGSGDTGSSSSSSGGAVTNNINVNVTIDKAGGEVSTESNDTQGTASSYSKEKELSQKIKAAVLDVIRQEKRVGGELS